MEGRKDVLLSTMGKTSIHCLSAGKERKKKKCRQKKKEESCKGGLVGGGGGGGRGGGVIGVGWGCGGGFVRRFWFLGSGGGRGDILEKKLVLGSLLDNGSRKKNRAFC